MVMAMTMAIMIYTSWRGFELFGIISCGRSITAGGYSVIIEAVRIGRPPHHVVLVFGDI